MTQRKRRTYVLVALLSIGALAVDRLVLRSDAGPVDAHAKDRRTAAVTTMATGAASGSLTIPELPFPRDLPPVSDVEPFRDLFSRKPAKPPALDEATEKSNADAAQRRASDSSSFIAQHRLEAVMNNAGLEIAVVNGVWLRVGQSIGECKLVSIEGTRARFDCRNDEAVLDLRDSSGLLGSGR